MDFKICLRTFAVLAVTVGWYPNQTQAQNRTKPNIVLIFVDDMGYGDLGCYGSKLAPTPNIDRLAAGGIRCTDGYAAAATCAPSRLGLMSGRYQQRFGAYSNSTSPRAKIPADQLFIPQMLKQAGYHTAHIGKWHINRPVESVFDELFNEIQGAADYFPGPNGKLTGKLVHPMQHGWSSQEGTPYITDAHGDAAVKFIKNRVPQKEPFFLYLAFNAPHSPWQAPLELKGKYAHVSPEVMQLYAAMIHSLDQNVGKVLKQLDESGVADHTLVLFISDNGPEWGRNYPTLNWPARWDSTIVGSAGPLSGRKAEFLEGGIRVPFILRWPGVLKANSVYTRPVSTLDLYETFRVLAQGTATTTDGVNLLPFLTGKELADPHKVLFWQGGATHPVYARMGDWKIVAPLDKENPELYHLTDDMGEKQNVASQNKGIVQEILGLVKDWMEDIRRMSDTE